MHCFGHLLSERVEFLRSDRSRVSEPFSVGSDASGSVDHLVGSFVSASQIATDHFSIAIVFRLSLTIHMNAVDRRTITHVVILAHSVGVVRTVTLVDRVFLHSKRPRKSNVNE